MNNPTAECDLSQLNSKDISYEDLLETAFNPDTPDVYASYLQKVLKQTRERANEIDWAMEAFAFVLNPKTGKITVWG